MIANIIYFAGGFIAGMAAGIAIIAIVSANDDR